MARVAMDENSGRNFSRDSSFPHGDGGVQHGEPLIHDGTPVVDGAVLDSGSPTRKLIDAIFIVRRFITSYRVVAGNSHDEADVVLAHELVRRPIQPIAADVVAGAICPIPPVLREDLDDCVRLVDSGSFQIAGEPNQARIFRTPRFPRTLATG